MANEVVCTVCGKHFKSGAGLAGHMMIVHPAAKEELQVSTEEAVLELLGSLKEGLERFETKFEPLVGQLKTVDERLNDFQSDMLDRVKIAEEIRDHAQAELLCWSRGEQHIRLRSLWDNAAELCPGCEADKQAIIAELKVQFEAETEPVIEAELVPAPAPEATEAPEYIERNGLLWHVPKVKNKASEDSGEAAKLSAEAPTQTAKSKRWRVVSKPAPLAFLSDKLVEELPTGVKPPGKGDTTLDKALAKVWERAGYQVEEVIEEPATALSTAQEDNEPEPKTVGDFLMRKKR